MTLWLKRTTLVLFIACAVFAWAYLIAGYVNCHTAGGKYVRGLFWMECIKP
jgi:hypothetical protein